MNDFIASNIFGWYQSLEEQLVDFLDVVPVHEQNLKTWSPKLATIMVESCGLIDSVFRYFSPETPKVRGKIKKRDDLVFGDYSKLYKNLLLFKRKVIFLARPPEYRIPFNDWRDSSKVPEWWAIYNKLKHNRLEKIFDANLENAINSLAGSLLVITAVQGLGPYLISQKWFNLRGFNPEVVIELSQKGFDCREPFTVETSIFVIVLGQKNFELPENIDDFRPLLYGGSSRLMAFFRKY